ncbi:MAG: DUF1667 domain-containing protein [Synergistaceae bacterium]|jgi:CxxC motif-containing protein|nr:DUF1667 domain-containing protein [Synergistaceae bacterium]
MSENGGADIVRGEFICVVCPRGCAIDAEFERSPRPRLISSVGHGCFRGEMWVEREIEFPMRTIATSVSVWGGDCLCASVRTCSPVPLEDVRFVMGELRGVSLDAPVLMGDEVMTIQTPRGDAPVTVIATRSVRRAG